VNEGIPKAFQSVRKIPNTQPKLSHIPREWGIFSARDTEDFEIFSGPRERAIYHSSEIEHFEILSDHLDGPMPNTQDKSSILKSKYLKPHEIPQEKFFFWNVKGFNQNPLKR
jgi:hypothetical protein